MDGTSQQGQQKTLEADVVRAKQFEVVLDGEVVATLKGVELKGVETKAGKKALGIYGEGETLIALLVANPDVGRLTIYNKDEKPVAGLDATPDGGRFILWSPDGRKLFSAPSGGRGRVGVAANRATHRPARR